MGVPSIESGSIEHHVETPREPKFVIKPKIHDSITFDKYLGIHSIFLAIAGIFQAIQANLNGQLSRTMGGGFTAWLSFSVGFVILLVYFLVDSKGGTTIQWRALFKQAPWWCWTGGLLGSMYVLLMTLIIPYRGSAVTNGITISGKLLCSVVFDHFGVLGLKTRRLSLLRLAGTALMAGGILMVSLG
ncbi:hypothetical protein H4219_001057 [Mycoemilia scoparia]|uniref:Uncharacterized protein n=1 Tax=Mycoemilia scoparia TaxID=417184 RepID=A0A9W8DQU3_9FUNG|nr:hypothetical protein H4219_001057 [Mycoemilia scoparia]